MSFRPCSALPPIPDGARLMGALMTSYTPVSFEDLHRLVLPHLLRTRRDDNDDSPPVLFAGETLDALRQVKDRITCITSVARKDETVNGTDRFTDIWRNVLPAFVVGRNGPCGQHAKLWLWHWRTAAEDDLLQITISSTNLTRPALVSQIQAGWTATVSLGKPQPRPRNPWGALARFLEALGSSAGAESSCAHFIGLLHRCPTESGIRFLTSIPGERLDPLVRTRRNLRLCIPSVGVWTSKSVSAWMKHHGVSRITLLWPTREHGWVQGNSRSSELWQIPKTTMKTIRRLANRGLIRVEAIHRGEHPFLPQKLLGSRDARWSHAKCYDLEGTGTIIGSHNWSMPAWGNASKPPSQFELSVVQYGGGVLKKNGSDLSFGEIQLCDDPAPDVASETGVVWAQATWDGKLLRVAWRRAGSGAVMGLWIDVRHRPRNLAISEGVRTATVRTRQQPYKVKLWCAEKPKEPVMVDVLDQRSVDQCVESQVKSAGEDLQLALDRMLFERFDGPSAEDDNGDIRTPKTGEGGAVPSADYQTEWLRVCRRWARVVDAWDSQGRNPTDGRRLYDALHRLTNDRQRSDSDRLGAGIARDEIGALRREVPE